LPQPETQPVKKNARTLSSENAIKLPSKNARSLNREIARSRESEAAKSLSSENAKTEQRKLAKAQGLSLYEDQLKYLRYHKALMQIEDKKLDIIEMIREAVDMYIATLKKQRENP